MKHCPGRMRHWRIVWNTIGLRSPVCLYCGSPNPKPLTDDEWSDLLHHLHRGEETRNRYLAAAVSEYLAIHPERKPRKTFAHADFYNRHKTWGFIDYRGEFMPAADLVGKMVNIGDKNGLTFDHTTVTSFGERNGILMLDGGIFKHWMLDEEPRPVERFPMPVQEIARGYVHEEPECDCGASMINGGMASAHLDWCATMKDQDASH